MAPFALQQPGVELGQFGIQTRYQGREAFAGARLDKGAHHQHIHQPLHFATAQQRAQAGRVTRGGNMTNLDATPADDLAHLLEVHQLLTSQTRHSRGQFGLGQVAPHQAQGRLRCLVLQVAVVEQEDFLLAQGLVQPGIRRGDATEKPENFLQNRHRFFAVSRNLLGI